MIKLSHSLILFTMLLSTMVHARGGASAYDSLAGGGPILSLPSKVIEAPMGEATVASYHTSAVAAYGGVMTREFDFEQASVNLQESFPTPEAYENAILSDDTEKERQRAFEVNRYVTENKRFVETFDETVLLDLPAGIKKTIGNLEYTVIIEGMTLLPDAALLDAYMVFEMPDSDKKLAFAGHNIRFSREGGLASGAKLILLGDHASKIGPETLLIFKGGGSKFDPQQNSPGQATFVEWDCNGFKAMGLVAEIEFSRNLFVPDNPNGQPGEGRVKGRFATSVSDWNNILAEVSIQPFQVRGLKGFGFSVKRAVFDHSSLESVPGIVFPAGYQNALTGPMWKGVMIDEMTMRFPRQFNKKGEEKRLEIGIDKALIDASGISAIAEVRNVLAKNEGQMDKWDFSVDAFQLHLISNQLAGAGFEGVIELPIAKDKPFGYKAVISSGDNYALALTLPGDKSMEFDFLMGTNVELYSSSYLEVRVEDGQFLPKAHLNGNLSLNTSELKVSSLEFEALEVQTVQPYIKVRSFAIGSGDDKNKLGTFALGVNNIYASTQDDEMRLSFNAFVHLTGEKGGSFGGDAGLTVVSRLQQDGESQQWEFDRVEINAIGVNVNTGAVGIEGYLAWFKQDPTYGDGFRGEATMTLMEGALTVQAVALFGKTDDLRYWFVDALASLPPGAGIGALEFKSFGGGAFYHVNQSTEGGINPLGRAISGLNYVPDKNTYLKVMARLDLATAGSSAVFNGNVSLEITFNKGGGIQTVDLRGNGYFVQPMPTIDIAGLSDQLNNTINGVASVLEPKAAMSAHIHINYDVPNRTLHGNFEVFVNVAFGALKGIGPGNRAGWAVIHVSPDDWYVHVGSPTDPLGTQMLGLVKSRSYFMVGDYIPGSPAPPEEVGEILGQIDLNYMDGLNALGEGRGIAFGSRFGMDTGNLEFLMFYGSFAADAGFDIMLKDYGQASCVGRDGPIGINGWYANGQAYGFFKGEIGIKVKLFGKRRQVEILKIGAAAILQAKLPNPFWMRGVVGGYFSVMNGLVKGNCKFEITIGEDCQIVGGSVLESIQVISQVTPGDGEREVSVFTTAQGVFNMEVGKTFEMVDLDDRKKQFRIKLDHFRVMHGSEEILGVLKWNERLDVAAYKPTDVLPSEKQLKVQLQVSFEENKGGAWIPVVVNGKKIIESKEITFTSDVAPDHIPEGNVQYSYPVNGQLHFHKDEYDKGYVKLLFGQPELFQPGAEWVQKGRFRSLNGQPQYFDFSYSQGQINFTLPGGLANDQIYVLEIVNLPANSAGAVDRNVRLDSATTQMGDGDLSVKNTTAEGAIQELQEKVIYTAYVQTSKYAAFSQKVNALTVNNTWSVPIRPTVHELKAALEGNETFDTYEINPREHSRSLVTFEANLAMPWYTNEIKPRAYPVAYPPHGLTYSWRAPELYGAPPVRALNIRQSEEGLSLDEGQVLAGTPVVTPTKATIIYNLPWVVYQDYADLRQKAAIQANKGAANSWMLMIMKEPFPGINSGTTYKVKMQYRLPGIDKITSEKEINFQIN